VLLTDLSMAEDLRRAPLATLWLLVALVPPLFGWAPLAISSIAACVLMVGTGCITIAKAHRSLDWRALFLIMGTIPLGLALEKRGVAQAIANLVVEPASALGPVATIATIFALAMATSMATSHVTASVIVAPIAASMAATARLPTDTALLAVAYGSSCAFMLPIHPWNLLVMAPANYRARDFLRAGAGMSLVVALTAILGLVLMR
jgi:di/tricarboxylate transporter